MDVFVFAFNGMTDVPNKMKCSKKLATIPRINKVLLPFRFFHRFKMMVVFCVLFDFHGQIGESNSIKLWTKVADTPRSNIVRLQLWFFFTHLEMVGPFEWSHCHKILQALSFQWLDIHYHGDFIWKTINSYWTNHHYYFL